VEHGDRGAGDRDVGTRDDGERVQFERALGLIGSRRPGDGDGLPAGGRRAQRRPGSRRGPGRYAEAQIQPLQQIHATSPTLAQAITTLAVAYRGYYAANGTGPAKTALDTAIKRINKLCPDAGAAA
jgi:hypothetical protein